MEPHNVLISATKPENTKSIMLMCQPKTGHTLTLQYCQTDMLVQIDATVFIKFQDLLK